MSSKRIIHARDIVTDIRAGMTDAELMRKYNLSARGLQSAFDKLVNNRIMSARELYGNRQSGEDTVIVDDLRSLPRYYLTVALTIYEPDRPDVRGRVENVTERGLGVVGIPSRIGEVKSFVLPCSQYLKAVESIWFEAKCLWARQDPKSEVWSGGYQITKISGKDVENLRRLIKMMTIDR